MCWDAAVSGLEQSAEEEVLVVVVNGDDGSELMPRWLLSAPQQTTRPKTRAAVAHGHDGDAA